MKFSKTASSLCRDWAAATSGGIAWNVVEFLGKLRSSVAGQL